MLIYVCVYIYMCIYMHKLYPRHGCFALYMRKATQGHAAPEGQCVYIRQGMRAWDITNMLHFPHSALLL